MNKIICDTNILISAIVFGGKSRQILDIAIQGKITIGISQLILDEFQAVLSSKKFQFSDTLIQIMLQELLNLAQYIVPKIRIEHIREYPADNRILECAIEFKADSIITGDQHLLKLKKFQNLQIITATDCLDHISI